MANCWKFCGPVIHRDAGKVKRLVGDRWARERERERELAKAP